MMRQDGDMKCDKFGNITFQNFSGKTASLKMIL